MTRNLERLARTLTVGAWLIAVSAGPALAGSAAKPPSRALFEIEDGLPSGGYVKLGRLAPFRDTAAGTEWLNRRTSWLGWPAAASADRTFMALEAGAENVGVRGFVAAAGHSNTGELDPRFMLNAHQRMGDVGLLRNVVHSASAGTGRAGERRFYSFTGTSRFSLGPLSFLGHAGLVDTELARGVKRGWNARAEAGWLVARRVETKLAYEWSDPNEARRGDERSRVGVRVDPLVARHVRAGVCYRKLRGPETVAGANADEIGIEINVSF